VQYPSNIYFILIFIVAKKLHGSSHCFCIAATLYNKSGITAIPKNKNSEEIRGEISGEFRKVFSREFSEEFSIEIRCHFVDFSYLVV